MKKDYIDYKFTINQVSILDSYPIPNIEDLFVTLPGGKHFNTHRGLFCYNRLIFGISSSPATFQMCMDNFIQGIPLTSRYQDGILISGEGDTYRIQNVKIIFKRLSNKAIRVREDKDTFLTEETVLFGS